MTTRLTETAISAAIRKAESAAARVEIADAGLPGLRLRITATGGKTWALACRDPLGRMRRFTLGEHPLMGISEAREAARTMRAQVRGGADPVADARHKRAIGKAAMEGVGTLDALLDLYERKQGAALKSWPDCKRRIRSVYARRLKTPLAALRLGDLQLDADAWPSAQSAAAAVRYLRPILKWAAQPGRAYLPRDLAELSAPATVGRRERVLGRDELARLLPTLRASRRPYAAAMRFLAFTLARREEAASARWRDIEFDAGTWTIHQTKNGKPHIVPLSDQALDLLRDLLPRDANGEAITPDSTALIFATETGGALANWDRECKRIMKASRTSGWTRHDLRRTGATMLGEMGELPDIIEAALNHTAIRSRLAATYNQSRYRPQVAKALQRLADALDGIEEGAGKLISMLKG